MEKRNDIDGRDTEEVDLETRKIQEYVQKLGLGKLAHEISEERFARRILESKRWIDAHDFSTSIEEKMQESIEQRIISVQAQAFDKAISYNNFVVTFGYAGFFAIWSFTKEGMHYWDTTLVALLLGFSLLLFILWTVGMTLMNSKHIRKMGLLISEEFDDRATKLDAIIDLETKQGKSALRIWALWVPVFTLTITSGLLAGLMLLFLLFCEVLGFDFTFFELKQWLLEFLKSLAAS